MITKRDVMKLSLASVSAASLGACTNLTPRERDEAADMTARIEAAFRRPVFDRQAFSDPVIIRDVEMLTDGARYFVRVRSEDGAEGMSMAQHRNAPLSHPIFKRLLAPAYQGLDARDVDTISHTVTWTGSIYKLQGISLGMPLAWVELAILDMLGRISERSVGDLLGGRVRETSGIYYASGDRSSSAEKLIEDLAEIAAETGARAIKHKVGARGHYTDTSNSRDRKVIANIRKTLGDDITLFADSNSSFDETMSLDIGARLHGEGYGFFEEPVAFDDFWMTRRLTEALDVPTAGGEQETSLRHFQYQIENRVVEVHQPDLLYLGGLCNCIRVARMVEVQGRQVVPHMARQGLGNLYVLHFASVAPNALDYMEWKGAPEAERYTVTGSDHALRSINGEVAIPKGPGLGVTFDPDMVRRLRPASSA